MFSRGLAVLTTVTWLAGNAAVARAESTAPVDGAPRAPKAGMYVAAVGTSDSSRLYRLIDRGRIDLMSDLVDSLLDTIAGMSSYQKPSVAPRVFKVSRAEIEQTMCRGPCAVRAWHLPESGIFIDDSLTPETDLAHRSILFHELVHFVQDLNGVGEGLDECDRWLQREREAYWLQNQYLALIGNSKSYHMMLANQSWIDANRTACEGTRRTINAAQ